MMSNMQELSVQDWLDAGYKKHDQYINLSDYLLQKLISDNKGKRYYITVFVYEHFNKDYFSDAMHHVGFSPDVQFGLDEKPTVDTSLILHKGCSIKEVEDMFNTLWEALGKPYYSLYEEFQ